MTGPKKTGAKGQAPAKAKATPKAKPRGESQNAAAARLTHELGVEVTRKMIRVWIEKGHDLHDLVLLRKSLRNQERSPLQPAAEVPNIPFPNDGPLTPEGITAEIRRLERALLKADDYETARTIRTQIVGMRDILKVQVEMGLLMPKADANAAGMAAGNASRSAWEKIAADLPPMLEGLTAMQMTAKLRDYARARCAELSEHFQS